MFNLAGPEFDLGRVVYAVLAECEHHRRSVGEDGVEELSRVAREKLAQIHEAYRERGGSAAYWQVLEREVTTVSIRRYVPHAIEHTRLERDHYGIWRGGDILARALFTLAGLTVGGIIVALPFIPIFEDAFAFVLAGAAFLYPEIRRMTADYRYSRELNRIVETAESYHRDLATKYVTDEDLNELLGEESDRETRPPRTPTSAAETQAHAPEPQAHAQG